MWCSHRTFNLTGCYVSGWQSASSNWIEDIVANQKDEFPMISEMYKGTFNIRLIDPVEYVPADIPLMRAKKNRSCISKIAKIITINGSPIEAFIYNGGWASDTIELISTINISQSLGLSLEDTVTIEVQEAAMST